MAGGGLSHWTATAPQTNFRALAGDLRIDVAVVGGGIAGLTAALLLKQAGLSVAVLEARRVGRQASGHSTGKLTAQHGPALARLVRKHGRAAARLYAEANQAAVLRAVGLAAEFGIACGLERKAACLVAGTAAGVADLEAEADCALDLGLAVDLERGSTAIPGGAAAVLRLAGQAQLNPCAYLAGLARAVDGEGSHVFEESRATAVEAGCPGHVATDRGTVTADRIVVATQLPAVGHGLFFAKAHAYAEPMLAVPVEPDRAPQDMLLWVDEPDLSATAVQDADGILIVAAGKRHKPGDTDAADQAMQALEAAVAGRFGAAVPRRRWTNHDYWSMDGVPFVGPVGRDGLHVATGFGAWGLSNGTVAGMLLCDLLAGRANPWRTLFDAGRLRPAASAGRFVSENAGVAASLVGGHLGRRPRSIEELQPGEAGVFDGEGGPVAASRSDAGDLCRLSAVCAHMKCVVGWNPVDRTWDCPCHGSRFDADGSVRSGPAVSPPPPA